MQKKWLALGGFTVLLLSFIKASVPYGSYTNFSFNNILSSIDPSLVVLPVIFMLFFAIFFFSTSRFLFRENRAIAAVVSICLSILVVYGLDKLANVGSIVSNIGISQNMIETALPFAIIAFVAIVSSIKVHGVRIGFGKVLMFIGLLIGAASLTNLVYEKGATLVLGIVLIIIGFFINRIKKKSDLNKGPSSSNSRGIQFSGPIANLEKGDPEFLQQREEARARRRQNRANRRAQKEQEKAERAARINALANRIERNSHQNAMRIANQDLRNGRREVPRVNRQEARSEERNDRREEARRREEMRRQQIHEEAEANRQERRNSLERENMPGKYSVSNSGNPRQNLTNNKIIDMELARNWNNFHKSWFDSITRSGDTKQIKIAARKLLNIYKPSANNNAIASRQITREIYEKYKYAIKGIYNERKKGRQLIEQRGQNGRELANISNEKKQEHLEHALRKSWRKDYAKFNHIIETGNEKQIKKEYLKLQRIYHPDVNKGDPVATEITKDIAALYQRSKSIQGQKQGQRLMIEDQRKQQKAAARSQEKEMRRLQEKEQKRNRKEEMRKRRLDEKRKQNNVRAQMRQYRNKPRSNRPRNGFFRKG